MQTPESLTALVKKCGMPTDWRVSVEERRIGFTVRIERRKDGMPLVYHVAVGDREMDAQVYGRLAKAKDKLYVL